MFTNEDVFLKKIVEEAKADGTLEETLNELRICVIRMDKLIAEMERMA